MKRGYRSRGALTKQMGWGQGRALVSFEEEAPTPCLVGLTHEGAHGKTLQLTKVSK